MAMFAGSVAILDNSEIGQGIRRLMLGCKLQFQPGQFLTIRCGENICPKPFAILGSDDRGTEVLYKIKGMGTEWLSGRKATESLYVVGPLGNNFSLQENSQRVLFVAGGLGIVPTLAFARVLVKQRAELQIDFVYGGRNISELVAFPSLPARINGFLVTENGDTRLKGLVTDFLPEFLDRRPDQIFACGPQAMLAKVAEIIEPTNIPCQVALETYLGCGGQGRCFGCAVPKRKGGYSLLCKEGPVFDLMEVVLDGNV